MILINLVYKLSSIKLIWIHLVRLDMERTHQHRRHKRNGPETGWLYEKRLNGLKANKKCYEALFRLKQIFLFLLRRLFNEFSETKTKWQIISYTVITLYCLESSGKCKEKECRKIAGNFVIFPLNFFLKCNSYSLIRFFHCISSITFQMQLFWIYSKQD